MAQVLVDAGNALTLWARRPEIADEIDIDHRNRRYMGRAHLPTDTQATSDPAKALAGLAGIGDLMATCTSPYSRNRTLGERLGRGGTMESALATAAGHIAEGVTSSQSHQTGVSDAPGPQGDSRRCVKAVG
jgi:glycerol-3-phosphate dehydrogenase